MHTHTNIHTGSHTRKTVAVLLSNKCDCFYYAECTHSFLIALFRYPTTRADRNKSGCATFNVLYPAQYVWYHTPCVLTDLGHVRTHSKQCTCAALHRNVESARVHRAAQVQPVYGRTNGQRAQEKNETNAQNETENNATAAAAQQVEVHEGPLYATCALAGSALTQTHTHTHTRTQSRKLEPGICNKRTYKSNVRARCFVSMFVRGVCVCVCIK